jgi:hypothetical protein
MNRKGARFAREIGPAGPCAPCLFSFSRSQAWSCWFYRKPGRQEGEWDLLEIASGCDGGWSCKHDCRNDGGDHDNGTFEGSGESETRAARTASIASETDRRGCAETSLRTHPQGRGRWASTASAKSSTASSWGTMEKMAATSEQPNTDDMGALRSAVRQIPSARAPCDRGPLGSMTL